MKLDTLIKDLRATTKPKEKLEVLKRYECDLLLDLIKVAYEPLRVFHVKIRAKDIPLSGKYDIYELKEEALEVIKFCENSNSNKQNREKVVDFLEKLNKGSQELFVNTINKNWKAGLGAKSVLKLYPGIISQFEVQLANTYDPNNNDMTLIPRWIVSYKLDGLRCVALRESSDPNYDKGRWTLYTRTGKEILTVNHLKPQLEELYQKYGWSFFDGELYKHGLVFEDIQGLVLGFTRGQAPQIEYHVFVVGDAEKFKACDGSDHVHVPGSETKSPKDVKFVEQSIISNSLIYKTLEEAFSLGYEGIMLRDLDKLYDYKRSNALLKLKEIEDDDESMEIISDCIVIDIEYKDDFPVIEDGKITFKRLLHKIWVQQEDGIECKVGSGFDIKFREMYTESPWDLLGGKVEIKHQRWGKNGRMRFPRLHRYRADL
jgi:ATP-dependent DNA ligase